ncbi:hypothetical protein Skr01_06970 [Sphaerisporangium krabiense]|uniref:AcrR family transcriptional regulator n=1 Tax=Sphaerisporangium krabiense TaxID=763782 RepID=A0A7W8ZD39_9ACTN|nr:helix-turn-helix domain-containing protein [Sphaerisporangium krabiense]MBB5631751.1 AcrR family transcriptional regulator [Sphaerisporangium krabiense]GII60612.1 hypothetical protein Skr01_06970 [Sphaerisporangium krabiense]
MTGRTYHKMIADQRSDDRRARLLAAGCQLFADWGYYGVGVRQLCTHANTSARAFYEVFPSTDALFVEVYKAVARNALNAMRDASRPSTMPRCAWPR